MQILYDNKALTAAVSRSTENSYYPVTNLQDPRLSRKFRTIDAAGEYVKFSTRITASRFAILGHNISETTTIILQGNDTDIWTTPSFEETLTWKSGIILHSFTEVAYNYWRLYMDGGSNSYFDIGLLYLGTYLQLPDMKADQEIADETTAEVTISSGGQAYGDEGYDYRAPTINFPGVTNTQRDGIRAMWSMVKNVRPVISVVWANRTDMETPIYGILDQKEIKFKKSDSHLYPWSTTLQLREVF